MREANSAAPIPADELEALAKDVDGVVNDATPATHTITTAHREAGLTQEQVERLYMPFPVNSHEAQNFHGFIYLKEEAISARLSEVVGPNWGLKPGGWQIIEQGSRDKIGVVAWGSLVINGVERTAMGGDSEISLGKENSMDRLIFTIKAAHTDLLKRAARMWGVGLYLTELDNVKNLKALEPWLKKRYPGNPIYMQSGQAGGLMYEYLNSRYPEVYQSPANIKLAMSELRIEGGQNFVDNWWSIRDRLERHAQSILAE